MKCWLSVKEDNVAIGQMPVDNIANVQNDLFCVHVLQRDHSSIRAHDELQVPLQRLARAQHVCVLRRIGLSQLRSKEVIDRAPHDVASTSPHALGETAIDIDIAARGVLGRSHHLRQSIDEVDEGPQLSCPWYRFDTHGVTVTQDLGLGKR